MASGSRVSQIYNLGRSQATLDFVDVDVSTDTKLFVSPRAFTLLHSEWADSCVSSIQNFFGTVLALIKEDRGSEAERLLLELREPNETHLGNSRGKSRGRALGEGSAHDVWEALSQSQAAKSGLISDLEDTVLLIMGIGVDIVSDITTNIVRSQLITYTQEQCRQLGIPLEQGIESGPIWNSVAKRWETKSVELPLTSKGKLLLVPKAIVRRTSAYDLSEYYRHYMLEFLIEEEKRAGSSLVHIVKSGKNKGKERVYKTDLEEKFGKEKQDVIDLTLLHPQVFENYKRDKGDDEFLPLDHEDISSVEMETPPDWDNLLDSVISIKTGKEEATDYERAVEGLLTALFYNDLVHPVFQSPIHQNRKRIDIRYTNAALRGFFNWLSAHYSSPYIFVECKNYGKDVANPELDQLIGRFSPSRGRVGMLVCRKFKNKERFLQRCRDSSKDGHGYVIALDDEDLSKLVEERKSDAEGKRRWHLLQKRMSDLVS